MLFETSNISAREITRGFIDKLENGMVKEAERESSTFIRSQLREAAFGRKLITPVTITNEELDRDVNSDLPRKIVEKEPDSKATFLTFQGTGDRTWFHGPRYPIYFGKIESDRFVKSKFELMTYENDIRKILYDNSVLDMAKVEDEHMYEGLVAAVNGVTGQDLTTTDTELKTSGIVPMLKAHVARQQPIGKFVMTKELYYDLLKLPATSVGDDIASAHYKEGVEEEEKLYGIPVITTIKNDILSNKEVFLLSPENYLGNFFLLQDATLFIKQEADIITFWSYSSIGVGIGSTKAITRMTIA